MTISLQQVVKRMNTLLDELLNVAIQLRDLSKQVITEEELVPLQRQQDNLLRQLEEADQNLQKYSAEINPATHEQFHAKLSQFQALNQEFVTNLNSSHGLIQFELQRLKNDLLEEGLPSPPSHFPSKQVSKAHKAKKKD